MILSSRVKIYADRIMGTPQDAILTFSPHPITHTSSGYELTLDTDTSACIVYGDVMSGHVKLLLIDEDNPLTWLQVRPFGCPINANFNIHILHLLPLNIRCTSQKTSAEVIRQIEHESSERYFHTYEAYFDYAGFRFTCMLQNYPGVKHIWTTLEDFDRENIIGPAPVYPEHIPLSSVYLSPPSVKC